jgi:threonine 3-dehydrogenase
MRVGRISNISRSFGVHSWRRGPSGYMGSGGGDSDESSNNPRVLVTGACGQIGMEIIPKMREMWGNGNVMASDVKSPSRTYLESGPFSYVDVTDKDQMARVILENGIDTVVHLASMLSATGEKYPQLALKVNNQGLENVLELARINNLTVFAPSTIAVFGPSTPKDDTPDDTVMRPTTMYGVTKVFGELLGEYYHRRFGVNYRSLRYPGVISCEALPGGGTTDYAVEIYYEAIKKGKYTCFLKKDTKMPMMYMPDLLNGTIALIGADESQLKQRVYNMGSMSFTPAQLCESIQKFIPGFTMEYAPDFRQEIADTWPRSLDDSNARNDWGYKPTFDVDAMTEHMLKNLSARLRSEVSEEEASKFHY